MSLWTDFVRPVGKLGAEALRSLNKPGSALVEGRSLARPVSSEGALPAEVDVVVVGGGIVGTCAALSLAERGARVLLCEKGVIGGEASGRAFGLISNAFLAPVKLPLIARADILWENMARLTGADIGYRRSGFHFLFRTEQEMDYARSWAAANKGQPGVDVRVLDSAEARALSPENGDGWAGGLLQVNAALVEPTLAAPAIAEAARAKGAIVLQNTAVRAIETRDGAVTGVVTEHGPVRAPRVIVAGGVWSPLLLRALRLTLPQIQAWASIGSTEPLEGPELPVSAAGTNYRRRADGGYSFNSLNSVAPVTPSAIRNLRRVLPAYEALATQVNVALNLRTFADDLRTARRWKPGARSPFERRRIMEPEVRSSQVDEAFATLRRLPPFYGAKERQRWAGAICTTPDNMPVIAPVARMPGLLLGTGFYYGLTMGPAAGEALADLATGATPHFDLYPYRYERFLDGSPLTYQP